MDLLNLEVICGDKQAVITFPNISEYIILNQGRKI